MSNGAPSRDLVQLGEEQFGGLRPGREGLGPAGSGGGQLATIEVVGGQLVQRPTQALDISGLEQQTLAAVGGEMRQIAGPPADDRAGRPPWPRRRRCRTARAGWATRTRPHPGRTRRPAPLTPDRGPALDPPGRLEPAGHAPAWRTRGRPCRPPRHAAQRFLAATWPPPRARRASPCAPPSSQRRAAQHAGCRAGQWPVPRARWPRPARAPRRAPVDRRTRRRRTSGPSRHSRRVAGALGGMWPGRGPPALGCGSARSRCRPAAGECWRREDDRGGVWPAMGPSRQPRCCRSARRLPRSPAHPGPPWQPVVPGGGTGGKGRSRTAPGRRGRRRPRPSAGGTDSRRSTARDHRG